uniref:4Fe-4S dicluster domain-containing protein n=1 Tax=Leptospirillum ferriphilum TaxID=178606 RepID=A0A7C3QXX2_9BACT
MIKIVAGGSILLDFARCITCGECEEICPTGVLSVSGEDRDSSCIYCRYCVISCPAAALSVFWRGHTDEIPTGFDQALFSKA